MRDSTKNMKNEVLECLKNRRGWHTSREISMSIWGVYWNSYAAPYLKQLLADGLIEIDIRPVERGHNSWKFYRYKEER